MTQTSSHDNLRSSVSALMDGECDELELHRVLKSLEQDGEEADLVRTAWSKYHHIQRIVRQDSDAVTNIDISAAVRDAIAVEAAPRRSFTRFAPVFQGAGKTAVAAAVMFGVVFGVQEYTGGVPGSVDTPVVAVDQAAPSAGAVVPRGFELPPLSARTVSTNNLAAPAVQRPSSAVVPEQSVVLPADEYQAQLEQLLFLHAEQASASGGFGLIPYARVSGSTEDMQE